MECLASFLRKSSGKGVVAGPFETQRDCYFSLLGGTLSFPSQVDSSKIPVWFMSPSAAEEKVLDPIKFPIKVVYRYTPTHCLYNFT